MIKIPNWDNIEEINVGEYNKLPAGGYICKIINVANEFSKSRKEMLVLSLDIAEGEYTNHFFNSYKNNTKKNKKWGCNFYQLTEEASIPYLKGLITSIEKSNNNFKWDFDEKTLVNKKIGMIFREEEYLNNNNEIRTNVKAWAPRSIENITEEMDIPAIKTIPNTNNDIPAIPTKPPVVGDVFDGFKEVKDDDLPF